MNAAGIILSNLNQHTLPELTKDRTMAAIPFGCRYRLVDFCLSNLIHADISNICVVANFNFRSLVDHIGSGKDWDLARRTGGIRLIAPYQTARTSEIKLHFSHLEALCSMQEYIQEFKEEYVVIMDSDQIASIDLNRVIEQHEATGASITMVTATAKPDFTCDYRRPMAAVDESGRITNLIAGTAYEETAPEVFLNIFVMRTERLRQIIEEANRAHLSSLTEMFINTYKNDAYYCYRHEGYVASITNFQEYYRASMEFACSEQAKEELLWQKESPVFTKVHNSAPTVYSNDAIVQNSMIADDCVIEGTVINSIVSRNVHVAKGAVVENSVLFWGTQVGKGASLNCVVADKDVVITDNVRLSGNSNLPIYIDKARKV